MNRITAILTKDDNQWHEVLAFTSDSDANPAWIIGDDISVEGGARVLRCVYLPNIEEVRYSGTSGRWPTK